MSGRMGVRMRMGVRVTFNHVSGPHVYTKRRSTPCPRAKNPLCEAMAYGVCHDVSLPQLYFSSCPHRVPLETHDAWQAGWALELKGKRLAFLLALGIIARKREICLYVFF